MLFVKVFVNLQIHFIIWSTVQFSLIWKDDQTISLYNLLYQEKTFHGRTRPDLLQDGGKREWKGGFMSLRIYIFMFYSHNPKRVLSEPSTTRYIEEADLWFQHCPHLMRIKLPIFNSLHSPTYVWKCWKLYDLSGSFMKSI